jgi:nudix motif 8
MRFDRAVLRSVAARLAALPTKRYDRHLPTKHQDDPTEYERRTKLQAAIAVPLVNYEGTPGLLFTVRSSRVGTHSGQVSFPGGHIDDNETPEQAAARELVEETGIRDFEVLGRWQEVRAVTGTMVTPVIGFVGEELDRKSVQGMVGAAGSSNEVDSCFVLTLDELLDPSKRTVEVLRGYPMSRFTAGPEPVWGLTAFILDGVLKDALNWDMT